MSCCDRVTVVIRLPCVPRRSSSRFSVAGAVFNPARFSVRWLVAQRLHEAESEEGRDDSKCDRCCRACRRSEPWWCVGSAHRADSSEGLLTPPFFASFAETRPIMSASHPVPDKSQSTLAAFFRSAPHKQAASSASSSSSHSGMAACMDEPDAAPVRKPAATAAAVSSSNRMPPPSTVPIVHSSLPFAVAAAAASIAPSAPGSGSSTGSNSSQRSSSSSSSSSGRRRKRASDGEIDERAVDGMGDDPTLLASAHTHPSPLVPTLCKLPARTLLYQLHLLRSDEKMVVKGVDTRGRVGGGVEMVVRSTAEEDASSASPPPNDEVATKQDEEKSTASMMYAGASSSSSSASASAWMMDERKELDGADGAPAASSSAAADPEEVLEPLSSTFAPVSHPLFPDSLEFVSLFLDSASAHRRFQELAKAWREKGVRDVRARVVEFQTTGPLQLLKVDNEEQRRAWMNAPQPTSSKKDSAKSAGAGAVAAQGMELEESMSGAPMAAAMPVSPARRSFFAKRSGVSSSASSSSASATAAPVPAPAVSAAPPSTSSAAASSLPSLYTAPTVPAPLRSVLDSREDSVAGFCVNSALGLSACSVPLTVSLDVVSSIDVSPSSISFGELILRGSVCASSLHILDDDKKGRWSQQLLTDLFGKMNMGHKQKENAEGTSSSSSSSASAVGPRTHSSSSNASLSSSSSLVYLSPSSFAPHLLAAHSPAAGHR